MPIINDVEVEECKYKFKDKDKFKFDGKEYCTLHNELCEDLSFACDKNCQIYEDFKQLQQLEKENEKIKKQYNCYACDSCGGKEDYINLKKHHLGLRKQFDEIVKRNNTLSLRIEEIEKENEELKRALEEIREIASWHTTEADSEDVQNDMNDIITKIDEVLR